MSEKKKKSTSEQIKDRVKRNRKVDLTPTQLAMITQGKGKDDGNTEEKTEKTKEKKGKSSKGAELLPDKNKRGIHVDPDLDEWIIENFGHRKYSRLFNTLVREFKDNAEKQGGSDD